MTGVQTCALPISGSYGPTEGLQTIQGDAAIHIDGVSLQNMLIVGDLYLSDTIGDGTVTLQNIIVTGTIFVRGGGENSLNLIDSQANTMVIDRKDEQVRVVATGNTSVWSVRVLSGASLEENLSQESIGFYHVYAATEHGLDLKGNYQTLTLEEKGKVTLSGKLGKAYLEAKAAESTLTLDDKAIISELDLNTAISVNGKGTVELVYVLVNGSMMEKAPLAYDFGEGVSITVAGRSVNEANKDTVFAENVTPAKPKPVSQTPGLPALTLTKPEAMTLELGKTGSRSITVNPSDAKISATSSNAKVATVTISGNTVTVTGKAGGKATITVSTSKSGYNSAKTTFTVTVNAPPAPPAAVAVKSVQKVENAPIFGSTSIRISLSNTTSPDKYTVSAFGRTFTNRGTYFELAVGSNEDLAKKTEAEIKSATTISPK